MTAAVLCSASAPQHLLLFRHRLSDSFLAGASACPEHGVEENTPPRPSAVPADSLSVTRAPDALVADGSSPCSLDQCDHRDRGCVQVTLNLSVRTSTPDSLRHRALPAQGHHCRYSTWGRQEDDEVTPDAEDRRRVKEEVADGCALGHAAYEHTVTPCRADAATAPCRTDEAYRCRSLELIPEVYEEDHPAEDDDCPQDGSTQMADTVTVEVESVHSLDEPEAPSDYEQNSYLAALQRNQRNLVLDSLDPEHVPHIVISPPPTDDAWSLYWAALTNRVGPQSLDHLAIPTQDVSTPLAFLPPVAGGPQDTAEAPKPVSAPPGEVPFETDRRTICSHHPEPPRVFSHAKFLQTIVAASQERQMLFLDGVRAAVHRHAYRAAVLVACSIAPSFRTRWDLPSFAKQFEKPFRWSDAAEPLLSVYRRCLGTTIIDSATPCTTPHIVIQEPPPSNNPWELYDTVTTSPQDCGYGQCLTVPASFVDFIHVEEDPYEGDGYDYYYETTPSSHSVGASEPDVVEPLTPDRFMSESTDGAMLPLLTSAVGHVADGDCVAWPAVAEVPSCEEDCCRVIPMTADIDEVLITEKPNAESHSVAEQEEEEFKEIRLEEEEDQLLEEPLEEEEYSYEEAVEEAEEPFEGEGDEDDLPPFDDWYQQIAQRTHLQVSA